MKIIFTVTFILFILSSIVIGDEIDYVFEDDDGTSLLPTGFLTREPYIDLFPTEPPFVNETEIVSISSSKEGWGFRDKVTMAAILLLTIPALVGFTLSFMLVNRSIFRSQLLPTSSPSNHSANSDVHDEIIEWEMGNKAAKDEKEEKFPNGALSRTTKTFQEWFAASRSPQSRGKKNSDFAYSVASSEKTEKLSDQQSIPEASEQSVLQKISNMLKLGNLTPETPKKNNQKFVINIFKEDDPFLELTVATPLDEQEDKEISYNQYLQHQALYPDDSTSYTLRI